MQFGEHCVTNEKTDGHDYENFTTCHIRARWKFDKFANGIG